MVEKITIKGLYLTVFFLFLFFCAQVVESAATISYSNSSENGTVIINTNMDNYTDRMKIVSKGKNTINFDRSADGINRNINLPQGGLIETYSSPSMLPLSIGLTLVSENGSFIQDFKIENFDNSDAPYLKGKQLITSRTGTYQIVSYLKDDEKGSLSGTNIEGIGKGQLEQEYEAWSKVLDRFQIEINFRPRFEEGFISDSKFKAVGEGNAYFLRTGSNVDMLNRMELNDTVYEIEFRGQNAYIEGVSSW